MGNRLPFQAMKSRLSIRALAALFACLSWTGSVTTPARGAEAPPLPAFPGAEGFGALATGGRGGEIYHVTTLADAGPGSFRDAVSKPNRIVVFDVGGVIKLADNVAVSSNITLLGQTAPGDGICLYNQSVSLAGSTNVIVRYLRFRQGLAGDAGKKALGLDKSSNIIVDHCSIEWGRWDDLGITEGSSNITVQYCIVAEAIHPQSFGALIDTVTNVTLSHNLWMSNESRNPKAKGTIQYINNVVYNWGGMGLCGGHSAANHDLDVINNYFIKGPSSNDLFAGQFFASDHVYQAGNYVDLDRDGKLNGHLAQEADFHNAQEKSYTLPTFVPQAAMHPTVPVTVDSAAEAYAKIVTDAGCSPRRDPVDLRLIAELTSLGTKGKTLLQENKTNAAADKKAKDEALALATGLGEVKGGPTPTDTDHDGLPDAWEMAHQLNPGNPADAAKPDATGYTNIEIYANRLVAPVK